MPLQDGIQRRKEKEALPARLADLERDGVGRDRIDDASAPRPVVPAVLPDEIALPYQALDPEGRILAVNEAWRSLFGYTESETLGRSFAEFLTSESADRFTSCFAQLASAGKEAKDEFDMVAKDGMATRVAVSGRIVRDPEGSIQRVHCLLHDITEHRHAQAALGNRNLQLEAIRAVAAEVTRELDPHRLLSLIARRAADLTGATNCGIYLWDEAAEVLMPHAYHGPDSARTRYPRRLGEGLMGHVARQRHGMLVNEYRTSPFAHPLTLETTDITAVLAEPLLYRDRLLGVIAVDHVGAAAVFTPQDQNLLALLADQAATAIENARLFQAEHDRRAQLEAIRAVTAEITQELTLTKVLGLVAQRACELTGAAAADIDLWDPERRLLVAEVSYGHASPRPATTRRPGEGAMGTVAETRQGLVLNDYRSSPIAHPETLAHTRVTASLVEPLLYRDILLGVIGVDHETPGRIFSERDQSTLRLFAAQAAIAIANARFYGETERRRREADVLASLVQSITASLDLDTVLQRVTEGAKWLCSGDVAAIALREKSELAFRYWTGLVTPTYTTLRIREGQGLGGKVLAEGHPVRTSNYREDQAITPDFHEVARVEGFVAEMAVPIRIEEVVAGVLFVMRRTAHAFTEADEAVLTRLADQAAIAIGNARLFRDQQRAYMELQKAQDELIRAGKLRALGQMAAGIAHDLNNRLATILGQTELAKLHDASPEIRDALRILETAATDGARVVRRLQDFARQEGGTTPLSPVALRDVVAEAIELTRPRWQDEARRGGISITIESCPEGLPSILGNPSEIRDVLTNLIFNAVDAMPDGGKISFAGRVEPGGVVVTVTDTGVGMSDDVRQRIFEPFFTTKGVKGSGLGLSAVYGIMIRHGGQIIATSAPGHGTTFTLRFRAVPDAVPPYEAGNTVPRSPSRLLVIDDEPFVRSTVAGLLRAAGHAVVEADSGAAGLKRLSEAAVDCVITDLGMPGMTGWEVAQAIKARTPQLPVLLLTGWADQAEKDAGSSAVDGILHKPVRLNDLLRAIGDATQSAGTDERPAAS
jgi:PAS domain S-box-containing protein